MIADEPRVWRPDDMQGVRRLDANLRPDFDAEQIAILAVRCNYRCVYYSGYEVLDIEWYAKGWSLADTPEFPTVTIR